MPSPAPSMPALRPWLLLALGSLVGAGALAALIALARMPPLDSLVTDPGFFRRCLVVHVDLSLTVWSIAFLAALFSAHARSSSADAWARRGALVAVLALVALAVAVFSNGAPVLSNYVPVIDSPLFLAGLALFALGALLAVIGGRLWPRPDRSVLPKEVGVGLRAAALALVVALLTFVAAISATPKALAPSAYYELVFWGGGHVLQVASEAGMLSVWLWLVGRATGRAVVSERTATILFALLVAPTLAAPLLAGGDPTTGEYQRAFTRLMEWGIFPVALTLLALCVRRLVRADRSARRSPEALAFFTSAALTATGFVLGALIRGPNTMVPAHYHACFGGVTAAYMAATYLLLARLGHALPTPRVRRFARIQPVVFGAGQWVFALGFALAGAHGMARKVYGAEQAARTPLETAGLVVMGVGGVIAVVGGVAFLWIALRAARTRAEVARAAESPAPNPKTAIVESHPSAARTLARHA